MNREKVARELVRVARELMAKKRRVVIRVDEMDPSSIKKAERLKARLENDGYILVDERATPFRSQLVYELPKSAASDFEAGDYIYQPHKDEPIYARVVGPNKGGGYKVVMAGGWHGNKAVIKSTKGWHPNPEAIRESEIPAKIKAAIDRKYKRAGTARKFEAADEVTLDVPLLIRVMEYSKEDAKTDMDLHVATEKMVELSQGGNVLTMENYDEIVGGASGD